MAELMLTEDLLSELDRESYALFPEGLPDRPVDDAALERQRLRFEARYSARGRLSSAGAQFAWIFFTLLGATAVASESVSTNSAYDGIGTLRSGPVAAAAARRTVELWLKRSTRDCCGDAIASAPGAILTMIEASPSSGSGIEIAPGLPIDALAWACFDSSPTSAGAQHVGQLLTQVAKSSSRWSSLPTAARGAALCRLLQSYDFGEGFRPRQGAANDVALTPKRAIFAAASGATHAERVTMWSAAATYGQRFPLGNASAFFHFLLRGASLSGDAMTISLEAASLHWLEATRPGASAKCAAEARECLIAATAMPEGSAPGFTAQWLSRWDEAASQTQGGRSGSSPDGVPRVSTGADVSSGLNWGRVPLAERNAISRSWPEFDLQRLVLLQSTPFPAQRNLLRSAQGDEYQVVQLRTGYSAVGSTKSSSSRRQPTASTLRTVPLAQIRLVFEYNDAGGGKSATISAHSRTCALPSCRATGAASKCSGCGAAYYCGRSCQLSHWKSGHKAECQELARTSAKPAVEPSIYDIFTGTSSRRESSEGASSRAGSATSAASVWLLCRLYDPVGDDEPYAKLMGRPAHMFVRGLRALDADGALCVVRVSDVVDFVKTMPTFLDDTATRDPNRVLLFDRVL